LKRAVYVFVTRTALLLDTWSSAVRFGPGEEQAQREYETGNDCFGHGEFPSVQVNV